MKKIYLDMDVYLDLVLNTDTGANETLLKRIIQCEFNLVYSEHVLSTLAEYEKGPREKLHSYYLEPLEAIQKAEYLRSTPHIKKEARFLQKTKGISFINAMYLVFCIAANATLITRDEDLLNLKKEFDINQPEEL